MLEKMPKINYNGGMKAEKLSTKILETLMPENVLYAEFVEGGAVKNPGTVLLHTLEKKTLKSYEIGLEKDNSPETIATYAAAFNFLQDLESRKILSHLEPLAGHHVYKVKTTAFSRDDDNFSFILENGKSELALPASTPEIYFAVVPKFAARKKPYKSLEKFRKKVLKKSTPEELVFYDVYLEEVLRRDTGAKTPAITVEDYYNALIYIRFLNLEEFNLTRAMKAAGEKALDKYRLKYLIEKISWRTLDNFLSEQVSTRNTDLFFELNKFMNSRSSKDKTFVAFNINNLLTEVRYVSSPKSALNPKDSKCITDIFAYPVIVKFTDAAHRDILKSIAASSGADLRDHAEAISYYLANYIFSEDALSYADLLPAVTRIIEELPGDDPNQTNPSLLFWLASEAINRIRSYVGESKRIQNKCQNLIYRLFWPRISSVWPIAHYDEYEFKEPAADSIFRQSVSMLMSLGDISERNEELKLYLSLYQDGAEYPLRFVTRRAFLETLKPLPSAEERFERILSVIPPEKCYEYLDHPGNVKEASKALNELFRTDDGARITGLSRINTLECLFLHTDSVGVHVAILNRLVHDFDTFSSVITKDCEAEGLDPLEIMTSLYTAAAANATEENELPPLKALTKKISKYDADLQIDQTMNAGRLKGLDIRASEVDVTAITEAALAYARNRRKIILMQRSSLMASF